MLFSIKTLKKKVSKRQDVFNYNFYIFSKNILLKKLFTFIDIIFLITFIIGV